MVDTGDLKSPGSDTVPVRVRSPAPQILYRGVEQLVARRAHNPEAAGSNPVPATMKYTLELQSFRGFFYARNGLIPMGPGDVHLFTSSYI